MTAPEPLTVLIDGLTAETRIAVLAGHEPIAFSLHPPSSGPRLGDVYRGRVRALSAGGAFVDLDDGVDGFLPRKKSMKAFPGEGDAVTVEVRREGVRGKGCRLGLSDLAAGEGPVPARISEAPPPAVAALTECDPAAIARIAVEGLATHAAVLRWIEREAPELAGRLSLHAAAPPLFWAEGVEDDLGQALESVVPMPGGGRIAIEETAACVAIDIDSGSESPAKVNRAAARLIADAIRLRGLAGVIMVDPAGSAERNHGFALAEALKDELADRAVDGEVKGVTRAGLVEIVRRRTRESLAETLGRLRTKAYAAIRAAHAVAAVHPGKPLRLTGNVDLVELLRRERFAPEVAAFRARHGVDLRLAVDPAMARGAARVEPETS